MFTLFRKEMDVSRRIHPRTPLSLHPVPFVGSYPITSPTTVDCGLWSVVSGLLPLWPGCLIGSQRKVVPSMHIVAISGANIRHQPRGTSVRLAEQMLDQIKLLLPEATGDVIPLVDKQIAPCVGCGGCISGGESCLVMDDFQDIYAKLRAADGLVFVSPHYAPIPAKLCALLERIESIAFLNRWKDDSHPSHLGGKPVAMIAHGGAAGDELQRFYLDVVLKPMGNAFGFPVSAKIVKIDEWPHIGVITGPCKVEQDERFPLQHYNEDEIKAKLGRLAEAMVRALSGARA